MSSPGNSCLKRTVCGAAAACPGTLPPRTTATALPQGSEAVRKSRKKDEAPLPDAERPSNVQEEVGEVPDLNRMEEGRNEKE